jgi:hypothetical protein
MIYSPDFFIPGTSRPYSTSIRIALGTKTVNGLIGDMLITIDDGSKEGRNLRLSNTIYILNLRINLISQYKLADKRITIEFGGKKVLFKRLDGAILVKGRRSG